jgi:hypothetical protein
VQGGTQIILDEIHRLYLEFCKMEGHPGITQSAQRTAGYAALPDGTNCPPLPESPLRDAFIGNWALSENPAGFRTCTITDEEIVLPSDAFRFSFPLAKEGFGKTPEPHYGETFYVWNRVLRDGCLYLYVQIMETCIGNIRIVIKPSDGNLTIYMHKIEESLFSELNGFLEGRKI